MRRYCYCKREGLAVHKPGCVHAGKPVNYSIPAAARVRAEARRDQRNADHIDGYDRDDTGPSEDLGSGPGTGGMYRRTRHGGYCEDFHSDG